MIRIKRKITNSTRSLLLLFISCYSTWGVYPTRRGMLLKSEQATQTQAVPSTAPQTGERSSIPRETGPPEQPQRDARQLLEQSNRPPNQNKTRGRRKTQFFIPLRLANHSSTDQVTQSLRKSIAVSQSLLSAWGYGAARDTRDVPRTMISSAETAGTIGR